MFKVLFSVVFFVSAASVLQAEPIISCSRSGLGHGDPSVRQEIVVSKIVDQAGFTGNYSLSVAWNNQDSSDWHTREILSGPVTIKKVENGAIKVEGTVNLTIANGRTTFEGADYLCSVSINFLDTLPDVKPAEDGSFTAYGFGGHREESKTAYDDMWDDARRHCASPAIVSEVRVHSRYGSTSVSAKFTCK